MPKSAPPPLVSGDVIRIVSTARFITPAELEPAVAIFKSWGFSVEFADGLFASENQFAGSDHSRAADFNTALTDPKVKAIFCARGGYGSVRMVDRVNWELLRSQPKWIFGYSDVTVLHSHLNAQLNLLSCHSSMPINFATNTESSLNSIKSVLAGGYPEYNFPRHKLNRPGTASGELVGGNLSVLYSLLGSASDITTRGKILFLEDLDEYLYHIDRMLQNLKRCGKLEDLAGLAIGGFTDMRDNAIPFGHTAEEIIADIVSEYDYPVAFNVPAGHIKNNCALIMGAMTELHAGAESVFKQKPDV